MDTVTASLTESERPPAWPVLGAIRAWAQPIVALTTGLTVGFEALARFDEYRGPVAEAFERAWATGMGPDLEAEALRAALRMEGRPPGTYLAVNVSPRALNMDLVRDIFDRDLAGIVVELTESHYVPTSELRLTADWLRARGARLAIDDLGTGYAGLERLVSVRPDLIKIDRSLVTQLETDEVSRIMVESLVRFASRVGAGVIAEGIEEQSTLEVVAELDMPTAKASCSRRLDPRGRSQDAKRSRRPEPFTSRRSVPRRDKTSSSTRWSSSTASPNDSARPRKSSTCSMPSSN